MNNNDFADLFRAIIEGNIHNIKFQDACEFVEMLGFSFVRQRGTSHRVYKMQGVFEIINLQNDRGNAKPYQVRQIRKIIIKYKLGGIGNE